MAFLRNIVRRLTDNTSIKTYRRLRFEMLKQKLIKSALTNQQKGIVPLLDGETEIVVSLTTHGRRINDAFMAIESILLGSVKPNRIVLWVSDTYDMTLLPQTLKNQQKRGLDIRLCKDLGPYTKLLYSLREFPNARIITIDDDVIYPYDTLEGLINSSLIDKEAIWAYHVREITFDKNRKTKTMRSWELLNNKSVVLNTNFFEGEGSVLYPPGCFTDEIFNQQVFMDICPYADDIWFNAMARMANKRVRCVDIHLAEFDMFINPEMQSEALWRINNNPHNTLHDKQLSAVMNRYSITFS